LVEAMEVLKNVNGLAFTHFDETDVVRHHLVQRIVRAYDEHKTRVAEQMPLLAEPRGADARHAEGPNSGERKIAEKIPEKRTPATSEPAPSPAAPSKEGSNSAEARG
jgi:hypothetical protein